MWRVRLLVCSVVWLTVGYQGLHLADEWVPDARVHMQEVARHVPWVWRSNAHVPIMVGCARRGLQQCRDAVQAAFRQVSHS